MLVAFHFVAHQSQSVQHLQDWVTPSPKTTSSFATYGLHFRLCPLSWRSFAKSLRLCNCRIHPTYLPRRAAPRRAAPWNPSLPQRAGAAASSKSSACGSESPPPSPTPSPLASFALPATSRNGSPTFIFSSAFGLSAASTRFPVLRPCPNSAPLFRAAAGSTIFRAAPLVT